MGRLNCEWCNDSYGNVILSITKKRGKISQDEILDFLKYEKKLQGFWLILLNTTEVTYDGSGWMDEIENKGDEVILYPYEPENNCPVCSKMTPSVYCFHCGERIVDDETF